MKPLNEHAKTEKYFMKYYDMSPKEITEFLDYIDKVKEQAIKQERERILKDVVIELNKLVMFAKDEDDECIYYLPIENVMNKYIDLINENDKTNINL